MFKNSITRKMFVSILAVLIVVFVILMLLVTLVLPRQYEKNRINDIIGSVNSLQSDSHDILALRDNVDNSLSEYSNNILIFSQYYNESEFTNVYLLTVSFEEKDYRMLVPPVAGLVDYEPDMQVSAVCFKIKTQAGQPERYLPYYLNFNGNIIINGDISQISHFQNIVDFVDYSDTKMINGTIGAAEKINPANTTQSSKLLLQAVTGTGTVTPFRNGFYNTVADGSNPAIIFTFKLQASGRSFFVVFETYKSAFNSKYLPLGSMIIAAFGILFVVLIITMLIISYRIAKPVDELISSSNKIKDFNFDVNLNESTGFNELNELSRSINSLASYLQFSLKHIVNQNIEINESIASEHERSQGRINFLKTFLHETKTPLAIIQATTALLEKDGLLNGDERQKYIGNIYEQIEKINRLLLTTLDVYKIDSIKDAGFETFDFAVLFNNTANSFSSLLSSKSLGITADIEHAEITASKNQMEIVINNIMLNAINYATNNTKIILTGKKEISGYRFSIKNEYGTAAKKSFSSGLGLKIVESILKLHNATHNITQAGSQFIYEFTLPYN